MKCPSRQARLAAIMRFTALCMLCYEIRTIVDGYRYHIEDLIHITENGHEVLSQPELDTTMLWIQPDLL